MFDEIRRRYWKVLGLRCLLSSGYQKVKFGIHVNLAILAQNAKQLVM